MRTAEASVYPLTCLWTFFKVIFHAPPPGFEPGTPRLTAVGTTVVLGRNDAETCLMGRRNPFSAMPVILN